MYDYNVWQQCDAMRNFKRLYKMRCYAMSCNVLQRNVSEDEIWADAIQFCNCSNVYIACIIGEMIFFYSKWPLLILKTLSVKTNYVPIVVTTVTVKRKLWPRLQFCWEASSSKTLIPFWLERITKSKNSSISDPKKQFKNQCVPQCRIKIAE